MSASVRDPLVKEDNFIAQDGGVGSGMIEIPEQELVFKTSRSSGPGGQNVNKVSTRVTTEETDTKTISDASKQGWRYTGSFAAIPNTKGQSQSRGRATTAVAEKGPHD
ncbi:MAG: peptide chain release factor-like protein [Planctomycetota bacterium]